MTITNDDNYVICSICNRRKSPEINGDWHKNLTVICDGCKSSMVQGKVLVNDWNAFNKIADNIRNVFSFEYARDETSPERIVQIHVLYKDIAKTIVDVGNMAWFRFDKYRQSDNIEIAKLIGIISIFTKMIKGK